MFSRMACECDCVFVRRVYLDSNEIPIPRLYVSANGEISSPGADSNATSWEAKGAGEVNATLGGRQSSYGQCCNSFNFKPSFILDRCSFGMENVEERLLSLLRIRGRQRSERHGCAYSHHTFVSLFVMSVKYLSCTSFTYPSFMYVPCPSYTFFRVLTIIKNDIIIKNGKPNKKKSCF